MHGVVEGVRPRGEPKKTLSEVREKDCTARQRCKADVIDRGKWNKLQMLCNKGWV